MSVSYTASYECFVYGFIGGGLENYVSCAQENYVSCAQDIHISRTKASASLHTNHFLNINQFRYRDRPIVHYEAHPHPFHPSCVCLCRRYLGTFAAPDPLDLSNRFTDLRTASRWQLRSLPEELEQSRSGALLIGQYTHLNVHFVADLSHLR